MESKLLIASLVSSLPGIRIIDSVAHVSHSAGDSLRNRQDRVHSPADTTRRSFGMTAEQREWNAPIEAKNLAEKNARKSAKKARKGNQVWVSRRTRAKSQR